MSEPTIRQCRCSDCENQKNLQTHKQHHHINVLMSRLDEQQRRWYAAVEAERYGHGGITLLHRITGLHHKTIKRGMAEIASGLSGRPQEGVRLPGAGRPALAKKK